MIQLIGYWLGGTYKPKENVFIWSLSQNVITFTDWDVGEPNNLYGIEHCLALWYYSGFAWYDERCHKLKRFICEKSKYFFLFYEHINQSQAEI